MRGFLKKAVGAAVRWFYPIAIYYWVIWSKLHRRYIGDDYKDIELKAGLSPAKAQELMNSLPWSADTWRELWDVCASPKRFQRDLNVRVRTGMITASPRDCDDFACWACNVIDTKYSPKMLITCYQVDGSVLPRGHVVCYVEMDGYGFHVGNWGFKGPFSSMYADVAKAVAAQKGAELLSFAVLSKNLDVEFIKRA